MDGVIVGELKAKLPLRQHADAAKDESLLLDIIATDALADIPKVVNLPDMTLDLTPYRIQIGDAIEYIQKHAGWQQALEEWSANFEVYGSIMQSYIKQGREIPAAVQADLLALVERAEQAALTIDALLGQSGGGGAGAADTSHLESVGYVFADVSARDGYAAWEGLICMSIAENKYYRFIDGSWGLYGGGLPFYWVGLLPSSLVDGHLNNGHIYDQEAV